MPPKRKADTTDLDFCLQLAQATPGGRRALAKESLRYKINYYLDRDPYPCQLAWCEKIKPCARAIVITGPLQGKTEAIARFMLLDEITENRELRILLLSATEKLAKKDLTVIRQDLVNPKVVTDYGQFRSHRFAWSNSAITVRRRQVMKDYTVEAAGIDSDLSGSRYDLAILDDPINFQSTRNAEQRAKAIEYVKLVVENRMEPWGRLWGIMNRWTIDDLGSYFEQRPDVEVMFSPTLIREPDNYHIHELPHRVLDEHGHTTKFTVEIGEGDPGEALNPARCSVAWLLQKRADIGTFAFNLQFQGETQDDERALIKREYLEATKCTSLSYDDYDRQDYIGLITGADPSLVTTKKEAEARDSDFTAIMTCGVLPNEHLDLVGYYHDRGLTPVEVENAIKSEYYKHEPEIVFLEINNFGVIIHWNLKKKTGIPIAKHYTGKQKFDLFEGFPMLGQLFENGQIRLPYKNEEDKQKTDALIGELYNPAQAQHDDRLAAFWIMVSGALRWINVKHKPTHSSKPTPAAGPQGQRSGVRKFSSRRGK